VDTVDTLTMDQAIPILATAMQSVLADAQIQVVENRQISIRFDGLPSWRINVSRHVISSQNQMIETQIDLMPLSLASMTPLELGRLATSENLGLRGVSVIPLNPEQNDDRGGLRVRASFVGQKGQTTDEVENLAIDILTVLAFARTLEDRVTDNTIAGEFAFELYNSRFESPTVAQPVRFITTGQKVFEGSQDRVFSEIMKPLKSELSFDVKEIGIRTAMLRAPGSNLEILAKIPNEIPIFVAHAPLMKLDGKTAEQIWELLSELNSKVESGHFEFNPNDSILSFTTWKHLTNDLRHFSFDHTIFSVTRAFSMATENVRFAPVLSVGGKSAQVLHLPNSLRPSLKKAA
jgi:predicted nuclease with RNAse H fold